MPHFSERAIRLQASPIRQILSVIDRPGMISFAGGLPSQSSFPKLSLERLPSKYLQYGPSDGEPELKKVICDYLNTINLPCNQQQILVLSGSQQGIDLVAKLFIDKGTKVALEYPTYLAALQAFRFFGAKFTELSTIKGFSLEHATQLAYVIPTFQNPTGYCYTKQERVALAQTCDASGTSLFEDDPYRDLAYDDCDRTPICSALNSASWVYQGSFSKCLAPGLRLGFLACSEDLIAPLTQLKQAADLHTNRLSQWLVLQQLQSSHYPQHLDSLVSAYAKKKIAFKLLLEELLSAYANWESPKGGLFFWLKLKRPIDTIRLLEHSLKHNVAFMPGEYFFPYTSTENSYLRLNFSHASIAEAERGLRILAGLIKNAWY